MPVENGTVPSPCAFVSLPRGFNGTLKRASLNGYILHNSPNHLMPLVIKTAP